MRNANWVALRDAPTGVFETADGSLGFKSEYQTENKKDGVYQVDAYVLSSGEYWWGGHRTVRERDSEFVRHVDVYTLLQRKEPGT